MTVCTKLLTCGAGTRRAPSDENPGPVQAGGSLLSQNRLRGRYVYSPVIVAFLTFGSICAGDALRQQIAADFMAARDGTPASGGINHSLFGG